MKILVLTNSISPYRGSEAAVGWNYVKYMSRSNHLHVIYSGNDYKNEIENYLNRMGGVPNVTFYFAGDHQSSLDWKKHDLLCRILVSKKLRLLHLEILSLARKIVQENDIDVVHYLNPIGFKEPGYLYKLDKPYIWGPSQGVENYPFQLYPILGKRGLLEGISRYVILHYKFLFDKRVRAAYKRADILLSATPKTQRDILKYHHVKSFYLPENGIEKIENTEPIVLNPKERLNVISVGSLVDRKGFLLQLMAVRNLLNKGITSFSWTIVGGGYQLTKLEHYIEHYGLGQNVKLFGKCSREQVQELFFHSHLNVITGLSEGTPTVLWESMSKGIPTISLNHCGMSGVLTTKDSFLIPISTPKKVAGSIAQVIEHVISNPETINIKSKYTIQSAQNYTWDKRVKILEDYYKMAIDNFSMKQKP